jgi:hypothetical protein
MKWISVPILTVVLLAGPTLAEAQGRGGGRGGMLGALQNPVNLILARADSLQLGLNDAQVSQLTQIGGELGAQNQPHLAALAQVLQGLAGGGGGGAVALQQIQEHAAPIRTNNQAALTRVREVLSEEQMGKVDAMLAAMAPGRGAGRGGGGGPG